MIEGWKKTKFGEVCKVQGGFAFKSNTFIKNGEGIPVIKIGDIQEGVVKVDEKTSRVPSEFINNNSLSKFLLKEDDVLIALTGATTGKVGRVKKETGLCFLNQRVGRLLPVEGKSISSFIMFLCQTFQFQKNISNNILLSAQGNISPSKIEDIEIEIPPLPEQRKIAYVLSTVQKAIEQQEKLIRTTTELKKALMQKLFTEGIGWLSGAQTRQKQTEIGPIPESWEVVELGDICQRVSINVQPTPNGERPYVGLEHIVPGQIYLTVWGKESDVVSSKTQFKKGEILYGKLRPYLDKAVIAHFDGISSTDILIFTGQNDVQNEFLIHFFHSERLIDFAKSTTTGVQHPRTSWSSLKKLRLGLPSKVERKFISQTLNLIEGKLSFHQKKKQTLTDLFKTLLHELMTGQRRVHEIEFEKMSEPLMMNDKMIALINKKANKKNQHYYIAK